MHQRTQTATPGRHRTLARPPSGLLVLAIAIGVAVAVQSGAAAVKVRTNADKAFDFRQARTWGWNPQGAGDVIVARTADDDPEAIQRLAEPVILEAVNAEMPRRGLALATEAPDLTLTYYLLLTIGTSAHTMGQFLPAVTEWGLPPFAPATTSFEVIEQGSLVFDVSAKGRLVWRGIGEAQIKMEYDRDRRVALLREAVREVLERLPSKG